MKKLNIAVALVLVFGLVLPSGAIAITADDEVTIRVMEMHEKSTSSVMNRIQLPEIAVDKVTEEANYHKRLTERKGEGYEADLADKDLDRIRDQEQTYEQEQNQERELDLVQDQIRDAEPDSANEQETGNETGAGAGAGAR
jgi:hypothetical protein